MSANQMNLKNISKSSYKHIKNVLRCIAERYSNMDFEDMCESLKEFNNLDLLQREIYDLETVVSKKLTKNQCIKLLLKLNKTDSSIYEKKVTKKEIAELVNEIDLESIENIQEILYNVIDCQKSIKNTIIEKSLKITFEENDPIKLIEPEIKKINVNGLRNLFTLLNTKLALPITAKELNKDSLVILLNKYFMNNEITEEDLVEERNKIKKKTTNKVKKTGRTNKKKVVEEKVEEEEEEEEKPIKKVKKTRKTKKVVEEEEEKPLKKKPKRSKRKKILEEVELPSDIDEDM